MILLSGVYAMASETTTDHFVVSCDEVLLPGNDGDEPYVCVNVSLDGANIYTLYQMDIQFPEGVVPYEEDGEYWVIMDEDDGIYPYTKKAGKKTFTHSLLCNFGTIDSKERCLRISCMSSQNDEFKATSGSLFYMYIKASAFAKPGNLVLKFSGQAFGKKVDSDIVKYVPEDMTDETVQISTTSKVALNVSSANKWGTCVVPFDAALPAGVKAYTANEIVNDGASALLKEAESLKAYTPYVLYAENGYKGTITGTVNPADYVEVAENGLLKGAVVGQSKSDGYVLQNLNSEVGFYKMNGQEFSIPEGKCWLEPATGAKDVIEFVFDNPTGIEEMPGAECKVQGEVYSLSGVRVNEGYKGIVIENGKKVIIR